jgi:Ca2+-binding RTX toxin-like protein
MIDRKLITRTKTICALGACGVAGLFAAVAAAAPDDGQLGGPPTTDLAEAGCPDGTAVTGLTGELNTPGGNTVVATIALICEESAVPTGEELGDRSTNTQTGTGSTQCDAGDVAVGIVGREGDFIDQITLRCQDASLTGTVTDAATSYGGTGGGPDGPYDCPAGQQLVGFTASEEFDGAFVRHVSIVCAPASAPVRCGGKDSTLAGTPDDDTLVGTPAKDVVVGLGGDDTIRGLGANDLLCGNGGRDTLKGGSGNDNMNGGPGRDKCVGGAGNDSASKCEVERSM